MFDASLADVSDRQSSLSSIFQHVIYIDSFIKDNTYSSENSKSKVFTELIEVYLSNLLLSEHVYTLNDTFLSKYYKQLVHNNGGATSIAIFKVVTCLQNLIIYLTYRSNGSPKKLKKLIDENVILIPFENYSQKDHKNIFIYAKKNNSLGSSKYFLNINYYNQYKYNFTSYLYRPFIISNSRYIKRYSDKMLVSITYLMDHIIKFHPFAFSLNNLETVPELISETKNPELREFIENLINYLSINHIRETEIGLFDYKYYNKTSIELTYISKIFEDESAAFNFSLDESYDIKLFIKMRIKELRSIFKNYNSVSSTDSIQFNSIVFLNALLADISFFDQEYDEAIISYSDAILTLGEKPTANDDYGKIYNYCKLKLKLGLTYEKMKSYELALSHYYDVLNYSRKYLSVINIENESNSLSRKAISTIFTQSCIASLYLVEKKNPEGVSAYDLEELQSALDSLKFSDYLHKIEIHFLFYNSIGHLLFYKNARFDNFKISGNNLSFDFESDKLFCWFKRNSRPDILDQRQCLESLKCYLTAACILYQKTSIIKDNKTVESLTILSHIYSIIRANSANQSKSLLVNFAQLCSNIADTLLTNLYNDYNAECLDSIEISCSQYYLNTEYLDQWHIAEVNKLIHQKITVSSGEVFQIIISLLYTSGKTFLWAGRSVSYGFQLKKILNIFRRIAEVKFLIYYEKIIRNCIFPECINVVSWNSSSTDRQQLEKYKHHFNLLDQYYQPHLTSRYLFSATSANPEIREVVLFYTFINHKLKVSELKLANQKFKQDDLYNRMNYHTLLSQYNLVSSQYIRIHELHLQYAINFTLINNSNNKILSFISEKWNPKNGYFDSYKINDANIPFPIDNINSNLIRVLELIKIQIKKQNYEIKDIESLIMEFKSNNLWKIDEKILKYMLKNSKFLTENKSIFNYIIKMSKIFGYKKEEFEEAMNIVNNSIYCLTEIIKIYNSSGINYLINYSSLGDYHRRLGEILKQFEYFKLVYKSRYFMVENEKGIKNMLRNSIHNTKDLKLSKCKTHDPFLKLIKVINKDFVITLKPISQFHLAIKNYYEALHLHQERYPYKIKLSNMYCLEDDFSDNLYHFGIALERQKINSGYLRHQIDKLKKDEINDTPLMNYDFHI
ncbi:MAG: hypothetical protein IPI65_04805 [Bacteroidetes bacterium]|nr:hypothetical protein [Bacteroidota bacterium]